MFSLAKTALLNFLIIWDKTGISRGFYCAIYLAICRCGGGDMLIFVVVDTPVMRGSCTSLMPDTTARLIGQQRVHFVSV